MKLKFISVVLLAAMMASEVNAQEALTKEQILSMSIEELSDLPLEDLMAAVETLGVSSVDELFAMIMNKNVSSASKETEDTFVSPLSSTVITRDEMRTYGVASIEEALRLVPGVIVTEKFNGVYDVQLRGLNNIPDNNMFLYTENANTLVLIDGRPAQNSAMGALTFDMLPIGIEDIAQIEVVRGATSSLYGAGAVTGVINIITEKPSETAPVVRGNIVMGSHRSYIGEISVRKAFTGKLAMGFTGNLQTRNRSTDELYVIPASGVMLANLNMPQPKISTTIDIAKYQQYVANGTLSDMSKGGYVTLDQIAGLRQVVPYTYQRNADGTYDYTKPTTVMVYKAFEPETPVSNMFRDTRTSRENFGLNGYITITPSNDVRIDITGGYQDSYSVCTPVGDDYISMNSRTSRTGYMNIVANVFDLKVQASAMGGPVDFAYGVPGFKEQSNQLNITAEYDLKLGDLLVRPGVSYTGVTYEDYVPEYNIPKLYDRQVVNDYSWTYYKPGHKYDEENTMNEHLSGFFNYDANLKTFAPSLRLDFKHGGFRGIAAYRAEKTNIPDKWTSSVQLAANYEINKDNFIRFVFGHSNRGAILVSSLANYQWTRTQYVYPDKINFIGNHEADLVKINSFEFGYRWKPAQNVLVDAEAYYSISSDYGALMAKSATMNISQNSLALLLYDIKNNIEVSGMNAYDAVHSADFMSAFVKEASVSFQTLPYEAHQAGVSVNVDYIISPKLIAKLNANWQNTYLDKYYTYSQSKDIASMLELAGTDAYMTIRASLNQLSEKLEEYMAEGRTDYIERAGDDAFKLSYNADTRRLEFADIVMPKQKNEDLEDGHKHKATPSFYGMFGLIAKPLPQLEVAAFANFIGKRTYTLKYGSEELDNRCTVNLKIGYKPTNQFELYFNAHNLLNTTKREFMYCDKIGGIYSLGVNFGF